MPTYPLPENITPSILTPGIVETVGTTGALQNTIQAYTKLNNQSIDVKADFGAVGDNIHDDTTLIANAITTANGKEIVFPAGTYLISQNTTFTGPVRFQPGAIVKPSSGKTLTFAAGIEAGLWKIFDISLGGIVAISKVEQVVPEWYGVSTITRPPASVGQGSQFYDTNLSPSRPVWSDGSAWHETLMAEHVAVNDPAVWIDVRARGLKCDGTTDDSSAFNTLIGAVPWGTELHFPTSQACALASTVTVNKALVLRNLGQKRWTTLRWTGGAAAMLHVTIDAESFTIDGFNLENTTTGTVALQLDSERCFVYRCSTFLRSIGGFGAASLAWSTAIVQTDQASAIFRVTFRDCDFVNNSAASGVQPIGIKLGGCNNVVVDDCMFSGCDKDIVAGITSTGLVQSLSVINSEFEHFSGTDGINAGGLNSIAIDIVNVDSFNHSGCFFDMNGDEASGAEGQVAIRLQTCNGGSIRGNKFKGNGFVNYAINDNSSAAVGVVIEGNMFDRFILAGIQATGGANLADLQIGYNALNVTSMVFDNSWLPHLTFGGASTGITYGTQVGRYQRNGNFLHIQFTILLTSKGSSTGTAEISNLPKAAKSTPVNNQAAGPVLIFDENVLMTLVAQTREGQSVLRLRNMTDLTGNGREALDTDFANTQQITCSMDYEV